jgi:hypothetical protein
MARLISRADDTARLAHARLSSVLPRRVIQARRAEDDGPSILVSSPRPNSRMATAIKAVGDQSFTAADLAMRLGLSARDAQGLVAQLLARGRVRRVNDERVKPAIYEVVR